MARRRTVIFTLVAALLCAALAPVGASARSAGVSIARSARPGGLVGFSVPLAGAHTCIIRAGGRHRTATVTGAVGLRVSFRVGRRVPAGTRRVSVACMPGVTQLIKVTVLGGTSAKAATARLVAGPIRIAVTKPVPPAPAVRRPPRPVPATTTPVAAVPMSESDALARARADWVTYGASYLAVFRNGQCTDWAAQERPDIVEQGTVRLWADHYMGLPDPGVSWNGGFWDDMARAAGMPVGTTPKAGAIVAFDPGTMGAGAVTGHVAYVEDVDEDAGTFTVSEMNAPVPGVVSYRTIATSAIAQGGITFVY